MRPLALLTLWLAACGGGSATDAAPTIDAPPSPSCLEADNHSDFDWINTEIFNKSCANFTSCHQGNNPAGGLNMTTSRAYMELVNVPSDWFGDWMRVAPCSLEDSYLMVKMRCHSETDQFGMQCQDGPLDGGSLMPPNSRPLCRQKLEAIERWILLGAPETGTANTCGTGPDGGTADGGIPDGGIPDAAP